MSAAFDQLQRIEESAFKSSVYTAPAVRSRVCEADVKKGTGIKCNLDKVTPQGLEKALANADVLVLPTFCFKTAAKVATLACDDLESGIVFKALLMDKKVLAAQDGFMFYEFQANGKLKNEIDQVLRKVARMGVVFCTTDRLHSTFLEMTAGAPAAKGAPASGRAGHAGGVALVTARVVHAAVFEKQRTILLAPGGIVTPLARDLAKEYSIAIESNKPENSRIGEEKTEWRN